MNGRPPQRRGLGRGLGSLIPSAPVAGEDDAGTDRAPEPTSAAVTTVPAPVPTPATADWIGRIPPPATGTGVTSGIPAGQVPSARQDPTRAEADSGALEASESQQPDLVDPADTAVRPVAGAHFAELLVASISPNPRQPRQVFDEEAMEELVASIREVGLLQPVVVRDLGGDRYELIMGERRLRATQQAGLDRIPAIVRDTGDDAMLRDALLENLHRAQLNPLEEAAAYQQLLDDFGCTHDELAGRIGRSRPQISNTLRLLKLSPAVQRRVAVGVLSAGHARTLLAVPDADVQDRLASRVVAEGISVRGLEEIVAVGELGQTGDRAARSRTRTSPPEVTHLTDRLSDRLDTRVKVDVGRTKGRLTIEFASVEDLRRIVGLIDPELDDDPGTPGASATAS